MSINKLFAVLDCQPTTPNRLRGEARNGRRAIYVDRSRRPDGDLRDKPGCVPASGCTKGAPWRATRCIGPDGSPVGGAQQRRLSPFSSSQEEKPYYLRGDPLKRAPGDQHRITPNAHLTAPWPIGLGWGVSGDNLSATFMPRLCVYGRLLAPPRRGAATGIGR